MSSIFSSPWPLPPSVTSQTVTLPTRSLDVHFLSSGSPSDPLILLLHGFPELSYSWRHVLTPLSQSGLYYVVAPDTRGFGFTKLTSRPDPDKMVEYDEDVTRFRQEELVEDVVALVHALAPSASASDGKKVHMLVGHDFGSTIAGNCTLFHPELFGRLVLMSAPYTNPPPTTEEGVQKAEMFISQLVTKGLAAASPEPKKHYVVYFSGREANGDMLYGGGTELKGVNKYELREFVRAYWHVKSADWKGNVDPEPHFFALDESAPNPVQILADKLPMYYIMPAHLTMPQAVLPHLPPPHYSSKSNSGLGLGSWMSPEDIDVYASTYARTGFQGGLNLYRCTIHPPSPVPTRAGLEGLEDRKIEIPSMFVAGKRDWGTWQYPDAVVKMKERCIQMREIVLVEGAGHWVQQEKPEEIVKLLADFAAGGKA